MSDEIDDAEFDKLLAEKQHNQFMASMRSLQSTLERMNDTSSLETAIAKLMDKVASISTIKPEVNVSTNQSEVVSALNKLSTEMCNELKLLKIALGTKNTYRFTAKRDPSGFIDLDSIVITNQLN